MKNILLICFVFVMLTAIAQPPTKFYATYGGNGYDVGYDVKQTLDGGYAIVGSTSSFGMGNTDMYLLKLDSMGQKKFEKSFGGLNNEIGKSIVQLNDSSYVMAGYTSSSGVGGYDIFLVKADKNGNLIWQKTIGGTDWDFAYSMQATSDGGFIIAGTTYSFGNGKADGYVVKTDENGDTEWEKTYGGINDDEFKSVIQTSDGKYALTGYTKSYNDLDSGDVWVYKLDVNGDSLWFKFYGGSKEDFGNSILELQNGNIYVGGGTKSFSSNQNTETLICTYDITTGATLYSYVDVSSQEEYYNHSVQGLKGNIANSGATKNVTFGYDGLVDIYTNTYGYFNFLSHGSIGEEELYSIDKTKDKGFIAVGITNGFGSVLNDIFVMKLDSNASYGSSIVGVNEYKKKSSYIISPNPASNILSVNIYDYFDLKQPNYNVVDLNGKIILSSSIHNQNNNINVSELSSGLYFLQIYDSRDLLFTTKFSVIR